MVFFNIYPKSVDKEKETFPDDNTISQIFELTYAAMTSVIPSTTLKEEDFKLWYENFGIRIKSGTIYILIFDDNVLKGYLAYKLHSESDCICIEDLIIHPKYQGDGITVARLLCCFFMKIENLNLSSIYTYTSKLNKKMQGILSKVGFSIYEYTDKGIKYIVTKEYLINKYAKLISYFYKKNNDILKQ
jgi:N-acetylglutamate synthase-like GNAT family acetyltransferase